MIPRYDFQTNCIATAPPKYVDAIYAVKGAHYDEESGFYIVPCDTKLNVSLVFA